MNAILIAIFVAFSVIIAFLLGAFAMFRVSEHYNREFRNAVRTGTESRYRR